jgi:hypothetical protein
MRDNPKSETLSEKRRRASLSRSTFAGGGARPGAGRPRSNAERCWCGVMTAKRAKARSHKCAPGDKQA